MLSRHIWIKVARVVLIALAAVLLLFFGARVIGAYRWRSETEDLRRRLDAARVPVHPRTIDFRELPLNIAMKQVIGNGKRTMAVFEDPNCGYCRQMRKDLAKVRDVTIYTFVIPILSADSEVKAKKALCAGDKVRAWTDLMVSGKVPDNAGSCETPLAQMRELAQKLGITATPTVFFQNGKRLQGYVPADQLERMLDENAKKS